SCSEFQTAKHEVFRVTSPRPCGERSPGEATGSRECAPDDRLREVGRVRGSLRVHSPWREPLILTFSPRKGGEKDKRQDSAFPRRNSPELCLKNVPRQ